MDAGDVLKIKTIAFHAWMFRVELLNTLVAITGSRIIVLCNKEKTESLKVMKDNMKKGGFDLVLIPKSGDVSEYVATFIKEFSADIQKPDTEKIVLGSLLKEKQKGKIIDEFDRQFSENGRFVEEDIGVYL